MMMALGCVSVQVRTVPDLRFFLPVTYVRRWVVGCWGLVRMFERSCKFYCDALFLR